MRRSIVEMIEGISRDLVLTILGGIISVILLKIIGGANKVLLLINDFEVEFIHILILVFVIVFYIEHKTIPDVSETPFNTVDIEQDSSHLSYSRPDKILWRGYVRTGDDLIAWPVEHGYNEITGTTERFVFNHLCYNCESEMRFERTSRRVLPGHTTQAHCIECDSTYHNPYNLSDKKRKIANYTEQVIDDAIVSRQQEPPTDTDYIQTAQWSPPSVATRIDPWYTDFDYNLE